MQKYKVKNFLLFSLIFLSQTHVLFRACDFDIVWLSNGLVKSAKLTVFLFVKHFTDFILLYFLLNPKGIKREILYMLFAVSFSDVIWFMVFSGVGYGFEKIIFSVVVFLVLKINKLKWGS